MKNGIKRADSQGNRTMDCKTETKKESRECGKGEAIRRGANIQKYVDNYDKIFRRSSSASKAKK